MPGISQRRRVDPTDMAVGSTVYQIDPAMTRVKKYHDRNACHVEFRHGITDR